MARLGENRNNLGSLAGEGMINPLIDVPICWLKPIEKLKDECREEVTDLISSYETLQAIVVRHETTIQKRWLKKKKQQRLEILQRACPSMAKKHRPEIHASDLLMDKLTARIKRSKEAITHAELHKLVGGDRIWMGLTLPMLNEEDLVQPRNLLLLLNARAHNHPCKFAGSDANDLVLGGISEYMKILRKVRPGPELMLLLEPRDYGRIVDKDAIPPPFDSLRCDVHFHLIEGLFVLQIQKKLIKFLIVCCQEILHDTPSHLLSTGQLPAHHEPEDKLKLPKDHSCFTSLSLMVQESAYLLPADLDTCRIEALIGARLAAAEDHIWALREDPGYFKMHWREFMEHDNLWVPFSQGQDIQLRSHVPGQATALQSIQASTLANMMAMAYTELEMFGTLHVGARRIQELHKRFASSISKLRDLPGLFFEELVRFRMILQQASDCFTENIKWIIHISPPLRRFLFRKAQAGPRLATQSCPVKKGTLEFKVLGQLESLCSGWREMTLPVLSAHLDELGRLVQEEPRASSLLSARIAGLVSDLSIILQCTNQLSMYYPWARVFQDEAIRKEENNSIGCIKFMINYGRMWRELGRQIAECEPQLCDVTEPNYAYPITKKVSKETTDTMRRAEKNIDVLWGYFDKLVNLSGHEWEHSASRRLSLTQRTMYRTPEWRAKPPAPAPEMSSTTTSEQGLLLQPLQNLYLDHDESEPKISIRKEKKSKVKTRGHSSQTTDQTSISSSPPRSETNLIIDDPPKTREQIQVNTRSLKVFRKLFFVPDSGSQTGEVSWGDFIYAMTGTGLFSAEKLYGSVWQFTRDNCADSDSRGYRIQFHEPHPSAKMTYVTARYVGRRLQRRFGWDIDTFVLTE